MKGNMMSKVSVILKTTCITSIVLLCVVSFAYFVKKEPEKILKKTSTPTETREFNVKVGDTFTLSLPENRSTGFSWQILTSQAQQDRSIELIKTEYKADEPVLAGSGGTVTFTFQTQKVTQHDLDDVVFLYYCRIWNGETAKIVRMQIKIIK